MDVNLYQVNEFSTADTVAHGILARAGANNARQQDALYLVDLLAVSGKEGVRVGCFVAGFAFIATVASTLALVRISKLAALLAGTFCSVPTFVAGYKAILFQSQYDYAIINRDAIQRSTDATFRFFLLPLK